MSATKVQETIPAISLKSKPSGRGFISKFCDRISGKPLYGYHECVLTDDGFIAVFSQGRWWKLRKSNKNDLPTIEKCFRNWDEYYELRIGA